LEPYELNFEDFCDLYLIHQQENLPFIIFLLFFLIKKGRIERSIVTSYLGVTIVDLTCWELHKKDLDSETADALSSPTEHSLTVPPKH
jgi:hypothetical protein